MPPRQSRKSDIYAKLYIKNAFSLDVDLIKSIINIRSITHGKRLKNRNKHKMQN